eukprot:Blabericola_migrator_1__1319@NODE_1342_length_4760_cov_176_142340_g900_i0_p3_GENE_NODE_1342_length_4760_cov_176_142340_g900_i0NODE_1342_length_4760_cov_176_142340_g900_i0_p3_ORF_typecomplete_len248_score39_23GATA/PF00320_27/0_011_NODE_1342_length_4760_cov_176_142340_g900_i034254168
MEDPAIRLSNRSRGLVSKEKDDRAQNWQRADAVTTDDDETDEAVMTFSDLIICLPQEFSFVYNPPTPITYRFDLSDVSVVSPNDLDNQIRTSLEGINPSTRITLRRSVIDQSFRIVRATGGRKAPRPRDNRRNDRDKRRATAVNNKQRVAPTPPSSDSSAAPTNQSDKMRCLRCYTCETPQWRYIHKGRYCNACYMRVKRWVENNRPGRKLPSRVKSPLSVEEDLRLQKDADDLVSQAFEALEKQGA